jgi:hypothetical protein
MELIDDIIRTCPKTAILVLTRPIKQYNLLILEKLVTLPMARHLRINGLPIGGIEALIVSRFYLP